MTPDELFPAKLKNSTVTDELRHGNERAAELSSIFDYPNLGHLFKTGDRRDLIDMQARLKTTSRELERVARRGTKEDAARAMLALRAFSATRELLEQLEQLRNAGHR